jgi:hypothetical protein
MFARNVMERLRSVTYAVSVVLLLKDLKTAGH